MSVKSLQHGANLVNRLKWTKFFSLKSELPLFIIMNLVIRKGEIITAEQRKSVSSRYKRITKAINSEFWNSQSETAHSLYVGSYGRGTAIDTSDIDVLVELPEDEYYRYDSLKGNGQSRLLQTVKSAILTTYPRSSIHADGQVVVVDFADGIKFEILPAFREYNWGEWTGKYVYPDSNKGGKWLTTDPKAEQNAMKERNSDSNGLLFDTCKHMREIRDTKFASSNLPGIVIDSFVYHNINNWHWVKEGEQRSELPYGAYEKSLNDSCPLWSFSLSAPGSGAKVDTTRALDGLQKVLIYMSKE